MHPSQFDYLAFKFIATCTHAGGETWSSWFKLELDLATEFQISPIQTLKHASNSHRERVPISQPDSVECVRSPSLAIPSSSASPTTIFGGAQQDMTGGAHAAGQKRTKRASRQLYALRRNDACAGISRAVGASFKKRLLSLGL